MFTVLWDNDGVLVDTEGLYFRACRATLATVGIELTRELYVEISLRRGASTFELAAERGLSGKAIARLRSERDRIYVGLLQTETRAVDGIEEVLQSLYGRVRMGVVTSTHREHFEIAHARTGLTKYLEFIIANEDYEHSKPHPEPYLTALARYRLRPEDCLVVEDSERGLTAATAAGLDCMVLLSPWTQECDFHRACKVLESVADIPQEVLRRADQRSGI
jgi:HAD superfamily hydrolase (TIGR01509 family)